MRMKDIDLVALANELCFISFILVVKTAQRKRCKRKLSISPKQPRDFVRTEAEEVPILNGWYPPTCLGEIRVAILHNCWSVDCSSESSAIYRHGFFVTSQVKPRIGPILFTFCYGHRLMHSPFIIFTWIFVQYAWPDSNSTYFWCDCNVGPFEAGFPTLFDVVQIYEDSQNTRTRKVHVRIIHVICVYSIKLVSLICPIHDRIKVKQLEKVREPFRTQQHVANTFRCLRFSSYIEAVECPRSSLVAPRSCFQFSQRYQSPLRLIYTLCYTTH